MEVGFGWRLRAMGRPSGRQHVPLPTTKMGRVPAWIASAVYDVPFGTLGVLNALLAAL